MSCRALAPPLAIKLAPAFEGCAHRFQRTGTKEWNRPRHSPRSVCLSKVISILVPDKPHQISCDRSLLGIIFYFMYGVRSISTLKPMQIVEEKEIFNAYACYINRQAN